MIRRLVFQWFSCRDRGRPSGRAWARALGISHTSFQKLIRKFTEDPSEMLKLQRAKGDQILGLHPPAGVQPATERAWGAAWRITFVAPDKSDKVS